MLPDEPRPERSGGADYEEQLERARAGEGDAVKQLFVQAYEELRNLAHAIRRNEGESLRTTELVHEAYLKLVSSRGLPIESRAHFKNIVARAMRQVLVDLARARKAKKRGGGAAVSVTLDEALHGKPMDGARFLELDEALRQLERADPRTARVVECRFFGGLDVNETAVALGISTATVKRDWRVARAWLVQALKS